MRKISITIRYEKLGKMREIMEFFEFRKLPVIDCHVHFHPSAQATDEEIQMMCGFMMNLIKKGSLSKIYLSGAEAGLYLKTKHPNLFYAGGSVPWSGWTQRLPDVNWSNYINSLIQMGYDGVGEMGSKPVQRTKHKPLDGHYYWDFWKACETLAFPVLCHVADPEEFWDKNRIPNWAKKRGWSYYKKDYPTKEELYNELECVLSAYPNLRIVLAHFYFMSADLERASDFLELYKNVNFDLSLGIELMYNISRRRDDWRDFFIKHQDRIFFGTDIGTWHTFDEAISRIWLVRNFLESNEEFFAPPASNNFLTRYKKPFIGLKLPESVLGKIYSQNFQRLWGKKTRKIPSH
jgi:predicted TIM-barrel fold metal-dependent hydrolase